MTMDIYAAILTTEDGRKVFGPAIPFHTSEPTRRKPGVSVMDLYAVEDCDAYDALHEPNPDYVPGSHLNVANGNAITLFRSLGLEMDDEGPSNFPIDVVHAALMQRLNGSRPLHTRPSEVSVGALGARIVDCGAGTDYVRGRLEALLTLVAQGARAGATHVVAC